jgi:hypothetical protein
MGLIGKSYEDYRRDNPPPQPPSSHRRHGSGGENGGDGGGDGENEGEPELRLSNSEIDEFILDAHRTKAEKEERRQIRELVLAYVTRHHDL